MENYAPFRRYTQEVYFPLCEEDRRQYRWLTDEELDIYRKTLEESEGFDAMEIPEDVMDMGLIAPVTVTEDDPETFEMLKRHSQFALDKYNDDKGTHFQLVKVLKANWRFCNTSTHYITFQAGDTVTGAFENFQAEVEVYVGGRTVELVRLEPKSQPLRESDKGTRPDPVSSVSTTAVAVPCAL